MSTQAVNHPYMVVHSATQHGAAQQGLAQPAALAHAARGALTSGNEVLCGVCSDPPEDCRTAACGHHFCRRALVTPGRIESGCLLS